MGTKTKFLDKIIKHKAPASIFLINGIQLKGIIIEYDDSGILFAGNGLKQFIFHQAISTIQERQDDYNH